MARGNEKECAIGLYESVGDGKEREMLMQKCVPDESEKWFRYFLRSGVQGSEWPFYSGRKVVG